MLSREMNYWIHQVQVDHIIHRKFNEIFFKDSILNTYLYYVHYESIIFWLFSHLCIN